MSQNTIATLLDKASERQIRQIYVRLYQQFPPDPVDLRARLKCYLEDAQQLFPEWANRMEATIKDVVK